jgi:hypothetical protein
MQKDSKERAKQFIILIIVAGYLIGTMTHIIHLTDVIRLGFFNSAKIFGVSPYINAYWLSLTVIDPTIAFLLIRKTKTGATLGFVNIFFNVAINSAIQIVKLPLISLETIYTTLGNIFNGLQIALLVFSIFTLPLILSKSNKYITIFSKVPILVLTVGLLIHLTGLARIIQHFESFWMLWVHFSMTILDGILIYLLVKKTRIGYIIGLVVFAIFALIQAGYAGAIFVGLNCPFNLAMALTISVCFVSIAGLIVSKDTFKYSLVQI